MKKGLISIGQHSPVEGYSVAYVARFLDWRIVVHEARRMFKENLVEQVDVALPVKVDSAEFTDFLIGILGQLAGGTIQLVYPPSDKVVVL